ncbi:Peptidyl-prolyl isomerase cwc27 [Coniosporium uncinatum]|uniref:Peptidyl-prolyl isomerase cwc27 n=1 Tax=Coniosporium uncinatum TaxID=93489 RepID=A0ACC3DR47_9PEZI|nr:Peptidyl-prolyl isomerase cwc27 [Coniosporium uncinatum]
MSALYNLEPQPTAKVLLTTTCGDILLELFASQTPLASRNFLQHCLDGYYDATIFHRLVPGFIVQGGDPSGTGHGGESAVNDGKPFADEFHTRLKFNRRGLLGMANGGGRDDNGSQFFLTLGPTPELQGRHTMFGRVQGDTIYNVVKMGEAELSEEARSRYILRKYWERRSWSIRLKTW